jgi:hypothetical protein
MLRRRRYAIPDESGQVATVMLLLMGVPLFTIAMAFAVGFGGIYLQRSQYSSAANLAAEMGATTLSGLSKGGNNCSSGNTEGVVGATGGGSGGAMLCADEQALYTLHTNIANDHLAQPTYNPSAGYLFPGSQNPCNRSQTLSAGSYYVSFTGVTKNVLFGGAIGIGSQTYPVCAVASVQSVQ